jgi:DNA-binding NarL/FixJ family response regulator
LTVPSEPTADGRAAEPPPPLRLLHDNTGLWGRVLSVVGEQARGGGDPAPDAIGIVTWKRATRAEVAELSSLREQHAGPLVAILEELPSTRGARAVAALLEGSVLLADLGVSLLPTLRAVAAGQCVVPRSVRQLVDRPPLSPRERQVLAMVVLDFSNAEIARKLVVTESNVKSHLTSAFSKLGVSSRSAAAELILDAESGLGPGILRISEEE